METYDGVVYIHHEADWSSTALVSWWVNYTTKEVAVEAPRLWSNGDDLPPLLPENVAVRAVRMAARGRAKWEYDQVLSRPVPGRALRPWSERYPTGGRHDPTDGWLFDSALSTEASYGPRNQRRAIPLGWVENVAIAMSANGFEGREPTAVLIDIGAPHRDPCACGNPCGNLHNRDCPQFDTFPRIGRLAINLSRVDRFIETLQTARTTTTRVFVP